MNPTPQQAAGYQGGFVGKVAAPLPLLAFIPARGGVFRRFPIKRMLWFELVENTFSTPPTSVGVARRILGDCSLARNRLLDSSLDVTRDKLKRQEEEQIPSFAILSAVCPSFFKELLMILHNYSSFSSICQETAKTILSP